LKEIIYNLLSNAIKFTPPGGQVSIRWEWIDEPLLEARAVPESRARALRVAGRIEPVFVENIADMPQAILDVACDGDVVITMGAGSIGGVPGKLANG